MVMLKIEQEEKEVWISPCGGETLPRRRVQGGANRDGDTMAVTRRKQRLAVKVKTTLDNRDNFTSSKRFQSN